MSRDYIARCNDCLDQRDEATADANWLVDAGADKDSPAFVESLLTAVLWHDVAEVHGAGVSDDVR